VPGARLAAPKFQGAAYVQYGFGLGSWGRGLASVALQHVDSFPSSFSRVPGAPARVSPTYGYTDSYNNVNVSPVGNVLLPQCGAVNGPVITLDGAGLGIMSVPLSASPETQVYFQAFAVTGGSNPALGTASNRVRIELN